MTTTKHKPKEHGRKKLTSSLKNSFDSVDSGRRRSETLSKASKPEAKRAQKQQRHQEMSLKKKRETFQGSNTSSTSFSLENIYFEGGLLSEGVSGPAKQKRDKRRILSFEDLSEIKKELSESSNDGCDNCYYETTTGPADDYSEKEELFKNRMVKSSTTPTTLTASTVPAHSSSTPQHMDKHFQNLSRNDIISLWRSSEKDLLNRLQDTIQQKRALEQKVAVLQRMLLKPP